MKIIRIFLLLLILIAPITLTAQNSSYSVISVEPVQTLDVKIRLIVYCKEKKAIDAEAQMLHRKKGLVEPETLKKKLNEQKMKSELL